MDDAIAGLFQNAADKIYGAAVLALVVGTVRSAWNAVGRARLGVGGIYVTRTSGTAWLGHREPGDDKPIRRVLLVKQFGFDLRGKEGGQGENAEWLLKARLTHDGFVQGQYTQQKPMTGISRGAFYLEQDRAEPARFVGLWTGWNAEVREIRTGTYEWVQVRRTPWWVPALPWMWPQASPADLHQIASIEGQEE